MNQYKPIFRVIEEAHKAWFSNQEMIHEIESTFEHLDFVLRECQKMSAFDNNLPRKKDFLSAIAAMVRCAMHYQILCANGCFDDARFFLRKTMEYFVVATAIGYDANLYRSWKREEFTRPRRGFSYVARRLIALPGVPSEEKELIRWMMGNSDAFPGFNQYHFLSNESVHGLSSRVLKSQVNEDGSFNLDIRHIKETALKQKMRNVSKMLLGCASLVIGVFRYVDYVNSLKVIPREAERVRTVHENLTSRIMV